MIPSIVITRHKLPDRTKCFFVTVWVGDLVAERSFLSRRVARDWAVWAVDNIEAAAARTSAFRNAGLKEAA